MRHRVRSTMLVAGVLAGAMITVNLAAQNRGGQPPVPPVPNNGAPPNPRDPAPPGPGNGVPVPPNPLPAPPNNGVPPNDGAPPDGAPPNGGVPPNGGGNGGGVIAGFGGPHTGLDVTLERAFRDGRATFLEREDVADGLGPVFNDRSCAACHDQGAIGGGSNRLVTRVGGTTGGRFDPLTERGGSLMQERGIGLATDGRGASFTFVGEQVPAESDVVAGRRTTPLFGLGLVDAVPDATFVALAGAQARAGGGVAGRVSLVRDLSTGRDAVGKFGWKAQVPTLFQFAGDAYLNEMGITSPQFPDEVCPQGDCTRLVFNPAPALNDDGRDVEALTDFLRLLGAPPRGAVTDQVRTGATVFEATGCGTCHVATLRTGSSAVAVLNQVSFQPYSDFLLHDMGSLGDGIEQGHATGREMRTAPLWGLRAVRRFLHDGSAGTLDQAIQRHDGQGQGARDRFRALGADQRAALLAFLGSL